MDETEEHINELIRECEANEIVAANRAWTLLQVIKQLRKERDFLQDKLYRISALNITDDRGRFGCIMQAGEVLKIIAERPAKVQG